MTPISPRTRRGRNEIKGQHRPYVRGHQLRKSLDERFWPFVDRTPGPDACWPWPALRDNYGYGLIHKTGNVSRSLKVHRVMWEQTYGPIPPGMIICHKCDNPPCYNPNHLFLGTHKDNSQDMARKGRSGSQRHPERRARGLRSGGHTHPECVPRGAANGMAALTDAAVRDIRAGRAVGVPLATLAAKWGVTVSAISRVATRRTWKHID